jgi:ankyrin repeat protein
MLNFCFHPQQPTHPTVSPTANPSGSHFCNTAHLICLKLPRASLYQSTRSPKGNATPHVDIFCVQKKLIDPNFYSNHNGIVPKNALQIVLSYNHGFAPRYRYGLALVLLEEGVQVDAVPPGGNTVLWQAVTENDEVTVGFLLRHGADATLDDNGSFGSPMSVAKPPSTLDIYQLLLKGKEDRSLL